MEYVLAVIIIVGVGLLYWKRDALKSWMSNKP